jgi:thiol-disulfide isomerase/thioredoxin
VRRPVFLVLLAILVALGAVATAGTPDARGWSAGQPAANAARVLGPLEQEVLLELPEDVMAKIRGPTLLVYFSPLCPHCTAATPEINALAERMKGHGEVMGVAVGRVSKRAIDEYVAEHGVKWPIVHDETGAIADAMQVRSTPSAVLVKPDKKGKKAEVVDFWYPYVRGYDVLVLMRVLPDPWGAFEKGRYAGVDTCASCHVQEADSWALTHHSIAWNTLLEHKKDDDAACTGCHVTGAGQPTGWDGHPESKLVAVGCEACHGPGGPHDGEKTDASAACATCHDEKHSIGFSYAKALPHIDHFRASNMDDAAWTEARRKLASGEERQHMVAFEGKTVGSAACKECHAAEHAQWSASPHGKAMATLKPEEAANVECVRCHATAKEAGLGKHDAVASFRTEESVGCESCHGPGEAHVQSGGKAAIEGLGEDCPVCVVEALCTSCHTPQWDEDWDLDKRLPAAGHKAP